MRETLFAFVVNAAWQSALIAALGLALARFLAARARFELLALTLVAALAAPALTFAPRAESTAIAPIDLGPIPSRGAGAIAWIYFAGFAFVLLRFALAAWRARRIASASIPFRGRTRLSQAIDGPVTIGRTVLLPSRIAGDRTLVAAALAHEHAHVRRNDYVLHVALELLALPLWFHPMIAVLRRAIADAREMACDEEAAARRGRKEYAAALVRLAALAGRARLAVGMADSPIERRVAALLHSHGANRRPQRAMLLLPIVAALACTRFNAAPAIEQATLCGHWKLIPEASDFRAVHPRRYDEFTQTIEQGPTRVSVRQRRTFGGRTHHVTWQVITDGVPRPIGRARGRAFWRDGTLHLRFVGPGAQRETATAFIRDGRLICDGVTERARYHAEFRRVDP